MKQITSAMLQDIIDAIDYVEKLIDEKIDAATQNHWTRCSINIESDSMRFRGIMPIIKSRYESIGYQVEVTPKVTYISWEKAFVDALIASEEAKQNTNSSAEAVENN